MDVYKKLYLIRMAEKIERNKKYAEKIGTKNKQICIDFNNEKKASKEEKYA